MNTIDDDGPAFGSFAKCGDIALSEGGMTLRDYFASKALPSILAQEDGGIQSHSAQIERNTEAWAKDAYRIADAMLKARKNEQ